MLVKNLRRIFLILAIASVLSVTGSVNASPTAKLAIEPTEVRDIASGGTFNVTVTISDVVKLYGWQVNVTFNPRILNVADTVEGPFLKQVNDTIVMKKVDNNGGFLLYSSSFMPPYPAQGAAGSGLLMTATFTVKGDGASSLEFENRGTYLNTVTSGAVDRITDFTTTDGSFRNAAGGVGGLEIPLEWIAGIAVAVVAVGGASAFFLLRRRKKSGLVRQ